MNSYRSLRAWQHAHTAALLAHRATDVATHPRARSLFDQLKRAAFSVEANITELEGALDNTMRTLRGLLDAHPPAWRQRRSS